MYIPYDKMSLRSSASLDSLRSLETLVKRENIETVFRNWSYVKTAITLFLLAWGIGFSVRYMKADPEERKHLEFLDNIWMGYRHVGFLEWIFRLWIISIIGMAAVRSFPQIRAMFEKYN